MIEFDFENYKVQGIKVNYYFICKRKLWLFDKGLGMEEKNDRVIQGKVVHENSYEREKNKEIEVDGLIKLDILDDDYIREVKISSKMEESDRMQLLYYLYYLKQMGVIKKGKINYVKEKRVEEIELTKNDERIIEEVLKDIHKLRKIEKPPLRINKRYCKKCAYYEFCYVEEEE